MISEKIRPHHLERKALLYVRQSSAHQVLHNRESSALQYAMQGRLRALGWSEIEVIDDDLGRSAAGGVQRAGFERMVAEVCLGKVGAVCAREVSRFARNSRDWQQLIEMCRVVDTVLIDQEMGRDAGHIAIAAGIAGGADVVLIPEVRWSLERVAGHIAGLRAEGRTSALVVVAEAAGQSDEATDAGADAPDHGVGEWLAKRLARATGAEARATVLGHVQRGAMPTAEDRLLASALGVRAVDVLAEGKGDRMVAWWNRQVIDVPLEKVVGRSRTVDPDGTLIRTARALGICLGDAG